MNKQEIFNKVVQHARKQKKRAIGLDDRCKYRTENGLKCFVGCLIPDGKYSPYLEGHISFEILKAIGIEYNFENRSFLCELQSIHDEKSPNLWELEFEFFAKTYNLNYNPI